MTARDKWRQIQAIIHTVQDGWPGPKDEAAINKLEAQALDEVHGIAPVHKVMASSFADPADVAAFRRCKAQGHTDQYCFGYGDNGVGLWGDDTTANRPMCALPPEDWKPFGTAARGKKVLVKANSREVVCELRDTMPAKENIKNGAGIDLNPAACSALRLTPPVMVAATWQWA